MARKRDSAPEPEDAECGETPPDLLELFEWLEADGSFVEQPRGSAAEPTTTTGLTNFVSRVAWGARAPRSRNTSISPRGTTLHWEGPKMGEFSHDRCASKVRGIQAFHMDSRGWSDIAYSALVCPHGYIYQGRWLGTRSAANGTNEGNAYHYAICYLGGDGDPFTEEAKVAFNDCIRHFDEKGAGSEVKTHREWKATMCAGPLIQNWKNAGRPVAPSSPPPPPPPPPPPSSEPTFKERVMSKPVLKKGATGQDVKILQGLLIVSAADLVARMSGGWDKVYTFPDAHFGDKTEYILREWQKRTQSLTPDGVCGPATWAWLVNV